MTAPAVRGYQNRTRRFRRWLIESENAPLVAVGVGLVVWFLSTRGSEPVAANDLGLVSVFSVWTFVGYVLVVGGTVALFAQRTPAPWRLGVGVGSAIVALYGVQASIQDLPGYRVAYRHVGVADQILRSGEADRTIDAYFNWPAFFTFTDAVAWDSGLRAVLRYSEWAPLLFMVLTVAALLLVFRALTADVRLIWLGVFFFALTNWTGQDYLSPQAMALVLHLWIVAIVLTWFPGEKSRPYPDSEVGRLSVDRRARLFLTVVLVALYAAMVPLHQLTPFVTFLTVGLLAVTGHTSLKWLPVAMFVMVGWWDLVMAEPFLGDRVEDLLSLAGQLGSLANETVLSRLTGTPLRLVVVNARIVASVLIWSLAILGWWGLRNDDRRLALAGLLGVAPFPLLGVLAYGGEMAIRVYLFSLPFAALLGAAALVRWPGIDALLASGARRRGGAHVTRYSRATVRFGAVVLGIGTVLAASFLLTRYGNARVESFSSSDVATMEWVYANAPKGSLILAASENLPWKDEGYAEYRYRTIQRITRDNDLAPADVIAASASAYPDGQAFLVLTRSQFAYLEALGLFSAAEIEAAVSSIVARGIATEVYRSADSTVYSLTGSAA